MGALAQDAMLGERYRLRRRIAIGGMGEVWRAEDTLLHRPVAVKVLKTELSVDPTFLERFRNEARSAASFSHSGIAGVFDYGEAEAEQGAHSDGSPDAAPTAYLVMELVEGEPLSAVLAREGRLGVPRTLDYVGQAAAALQVAHRTGMVHRDIKPGNLLIAGDGQVKITDFGIARAASTMRHTQAGMVVGTAQYFSPEQAEGRVVGPASDVYSLGVVAYECLSGHLPFTADSPVTVAVMQIRNVPPPLPPDVPPPVRAVVERAMAKDARWRYTNGGELGHAVEAAKAGRFEQPPAPRQTAPVPSGPVPSGPVPSGPVPRGPVPGGPMPTGPGPVGPMGPPHGPGMPHPVLGPPSMTVPAPDRSRGGRRLALLIVGLVLVLLAGLIVWLIVRRGDDRNTGLPTPERGTLTATTAARPAGASAPSWPASSGPVQLDPRRFVGHPLNEVLQGLRAQGLRPTVTDPGEPAARTDTEGTVKALMAPPGSVLRAPTWLPTGSQVIVVGASTGRPTQPIAAGDVGTVEHATPLSEQPPNEQQANR